MERMRCKPLSRVCAGLTVLPSRRNTDCDYSAAYVTLFTDDATDLVGHGMTFTTGRGTDIVSIFDPWSSLCLLAEPSVCYLSD